MASHDKTGWLVFGVSDEISCVPWVTIGYYFLPVCILCSNVLVESKSCFLGNSLISRKRLISRK